MLFQNLEAKETTKSICSSPPHLVTAVDKCDPVDTCRQINKTNILLDNSNSYI